MFVFLGAMAINVLYAQSFTVRGNVVSGEDNEPLLGLGVLQEGTLNGTSTDFDGNYLIEIKNADEATLVFSYMGYMTQRIKVNANTKKLDIVMQPEALQVDEVVVVAYGVRKKGTIAGSVSTVKAEKIESVPAVGFDQALQGLTSGMTVISNSGEPSKPAVFQIRGMNSINSGTTPLFILDGVPITSSDFNAINPSDIESINVLKDASSTSIYGARAANGVVVITTKRGTVTDKVDVTFRTQHGFSELAHGTWNLMNTEERIQFEQELGLDAGQDYDLLRQTDVKWLDVVFNDKARLQSYDLSVNYASDKINYYVSGGYFDQEGIAQGSTFERYNMRANVDVKAADWLKVGTNSMITYEEVQQADEGEYSLNTPISACRFMLPYWNPYREDGSVASSSDGSWKGTTHNPIEWMNNNPVVNKKYKALTVLYAEVTPIKNLTLTSRLGVDYTHSTADMKSYPGFVGNGGVGVAGRSSYDAVNITISNTASYMLKIDNAHSLNIMLGHEGVASKLSHADKTTMLLLPFRRVQERHRGQTAHRAMVSCRFSGVASITTRIYTMPTSRYAPTPHRGLVRRVVGLHSGRWALCTTCARRRSCAKQTNGSPTLRLQSVWVHRVTRQSPTTTIWHLWAAAPTTWAARA